MKRIDSHQHFWDLGVCRYDWLNPSMEKLHRNYLPEDLQPLLVEQQVVATVLVQASATEAETEFMLRLANRHNFIAGVVGWLDFNSTGALSRLASWSCHPGFLGIRPMLQDMDDAGWIVESRFSPVFEKLMQLGLTFDALIRSDQIHIVQELADLYPDLRIVVDHGAKPKISAGNFYAWSVEMSNLALRKNVYCKLSGLVTEASAQTPIYDLPSVLGRYVDFLVEKFGCRRMMWGSDWPVVNQVCSYADWLAITEKLLENLESHQRQALLFDTARSFYRLRTMA